MFRAGPRRLGVIPLVAQIMQFIQSLVAFYRVQEDARLLFLVPNSLHRYLLESHTLELVDTTESNHLSRRHPGGKKFSSDGIGRDPDPSDCERARVWSAPVHRRNEKLPLPAIHDGWKAGQRLGK